MSYPRQEDVPDPAASTAASSDVLDGRFNLHGRSLREHTARGMLINAAFNVGLAGLGAMRGLVVAAFLTASDYGIWGLVFASVNTLLWFKEIGLSDKFIQQSEPDQEVAFQKAFTLHLLWTALWVVVILAALPLFAVIYGHEAIIAPGIVLALGVLVTTLHAPTWIFYREMSFVRQRTLLAMEPVVGFVVTVALAAAGASYWSLAIGFVVGTSCSAVAALRACPYRIRFRFERRAVREYSSFSWPLLLSAGSGLVAVQTAVILGETTAGLAGVGAIGLAGNIARFTDHADRIVTQTLYPAVCAVRDRMDLLYESFTKSNRLVLIWGIPTGFALALFADDLVKFVFGAKWNAAIGLLQVFGVTAALKQVAFNWSAYFRAIGDTKPMAVNSAFSLAAFLAVGIPGMLLGGITGYAVAIAVMVAVDLMVRAFYIRRLFSGFPIVRHAARAIAPAVPAVVVVIAARQLEGGDRSAGLALAELALYAATAIVATVLIERALIREMFGYLRRTTARPLEAA